MRSGFTLIELVLYLGILAGLMLTIATFTGLMTGVRIRYQAAREVEREGLAAMHFMTQLIRNSQTTSGWPPTPPNSAESSSLRLDYGSTKVFELGANPGLEQPTVGLENGVIVLSDTAVAPKPLTSNSVVASQLIFRQKSGSVRIEFILSVLNPSGRADQNYSQTFYGSANFRPL